MGGSWHGAALPPSAFAVIEGEKRFHIPFRGRETDHAFLKGFSFGQRGSAIKDLDSTDMGCLLYLWQRAYDKK